MDLITRALLTRLTAYFLIGASYIYYLSIFAPLGTDWLDWHAQRIFNAVEYVRLNGYFSSFGFSIWSSCVDCSYQLTEWIDKIYLSTTIFPLSPYILINHFGGKEALFFYGPLLVQMVIVITGVLIAEIGAKLLKSSFPNFIVSIAIFILFLSSPWVYKMLIAGWSEVFFIFFLLIGLLHLHFKKSNWALLFFFLAGLFNYIWGTFVGIFYLAILILPNFIQNQSALSLYLPSIFSGSKFKRLLVPSALILPLILQSCLRFYASINLSATSGSSMLERLGVSGQDPHNGGILGALQFLAGNRVSTCIPNSSLAIIPENLNNSIFIFNCSLSLLGMTIISLLSIIGMSLLLNNNHNARKIFVPIIFAFFVFIMVFQQALSVHLMGFSYPFAIFFALGIASLINYSSKYFSSLALNIIFAAPLVVGLILLSTRVSFLTGLNG
jgi:hypothetical protein